MTEGYDKIKIYTDGASRGNPGPATAAYLIVDKENKTLKKDVRFLGETTNNRAEYRAVIKGLKEAKNLTGKKVEVYSDSNLLVRQLTGDWKVKNNKIRSLFQKVSKLEAGFESVQFAHLPRENKMISRADNLCNKKLDELGY